MAFECSECGRIHEDLPRYFMRRLPEMADGSTIEVEEEHKSMCRSGTQSFVRCEVEVPIAGSESDPLGFVVWVEVDARDYQRLLAFRRDEETKQIPAGFVGGTLANPVSGVPGSFGTPVKFEVCKGDPTPYVRWVAPGSPLATLLKTGASLKFWHDVAARKF
jgi:hypothetical protein